MSDFKREDLYYVGRDGNGWPINIQPLTDADFDAIMEADPRWVRREQYEEHSRNMAAQARNVVMLTQQLAEWERLGVKMWEDCPNCSGSGTIHCSQPPINERPCIKGEHECPKCTDGKVLAEGVIVFDVGTGPHYAIPLERNNNE